MDYTINSIQKRPMGGPGIWANIIKDDLTIQALVFDQHADNSDYELKSTSGKGSKISKIDIKRKSNLIFRWDRGLELTSLSDKEQQFLDFLCDSLSERCFKEAVNA